MFVLFPLLIYTILQLYFIIAQFYHLENGELYRLK